jgi:hypothetical protein
VTTITAPAYSTVAGAITGVALWALSTYAFHGSVPGPIEGACWVLIPGAVTGVASLLTKRGVLVSVKASQKTGQVGLHSSARLV